MSYQEKLAEALNQSIIEIYLFAVCITDSHIIRNCHNNFKVSLGHVTAGVMQCRMLGSL
jgi:hypothetical protein